MFDDFINQIQCQNHHLVRVSMLEYDDDILLRLIMSLFNCFHVVRMYYFILNFITFISRLDYEYELLCFRNQDFYYLIIR